MSLRQQSRTLAVAFVASVALTAGVGTALAVSGQYGDYSVNGYSYQNESYGDVTSYPFAGAALATIGGWTAPAGWLGVLPRLYKSNGALCEETSAYQYNADAITAISAATDGPGCGSGAYYSYSVTQSWNSSTSSYQSFFTFQTPNFNY
jgi:hypothetical protein